ncbi:MAG TPA: SCO1664 family protein [Actinomycetes bacterium]|nr:SCO1664 family protein [Actinomycetes bacterium]
MPALPDADPPDQAAGGRPAGVSGDRALAFLTRGELEVLGRFPWASNATLLARVQHGDLEGLAIYKPRRGERPLWDFPNGTLYRREVAAYRVSAALGWDLVPPTVARDGPFGVGSVQLYVEADPELTAFELVETGNPVMPLIAAFDVVVNNADRKAGHCLARPDDTRVWAIDHGVCFHVEPKLRTVLWDFAGQPLEPRVVTQLELLARAADHAPLARELAELLAPEEITALAHRAAALARAGCLPLPSGRRPYPWPLV